MPRPPKERVICPGIRARSFQGENASVPVEIFLDEMESLRLCDLEEHSQEEAAAAMGISRGTLQRLLYSARKKAAFALLYGKSIRTAGAVATGICQQQRCRFCAERQHCNLNQGEDIMKIAITCENNQVFQHFGHTPEFAVFTVEDNKITAKEIISCGETGHGALAGLLAEGKINTLICGGIGGGAQMALAEAGIELIGGASGDVDEVAAAYLAGNLAVKADFHCNHHHHNHGADHACGSHGCGSHDHGNHGHHCGGGNCHK